MTELTCRRCRRPIEPKDHHADYGIATCMRCNAVLDLSGNHLGRKQRWDRAPVSLPVGVKLDRGLNTFSAVWSWFSWTKVSFGTVFCVVWFGFSVAWYQRTGGDSQWFIKLYEWGHIAVGLIAAYTLLAYWLNRTHVTVEGRRLRIRHGPLPWPGSGEWEAAHFEQLYCLQRVTRSEQVTTAHFDLMALCTNGRSVVLLKGVDNPQMVLWLEQELEKILDLHDEPVEGELARRGA